MNFDEIPKFIQDDEVKYIQTINIPTYKNKYYSKYLLYY